MANINLSSDESGGERELVCRVNRKLAWIFVLGSGEVAFMGVVPFLATNEPNSKAAFWPMALMCWTFVGVMGTALLWLACDIARSEIHANVEGLRWRRGFSKWKHARWDEVRDFTVHRASRIVETPSGKLELSRSFVGIEEIVEMVPLCAFNAPAPMWETRGFRRGENWSLSLSPWDSSQKWSAPFMTLNMLCILVGVPWMIASVPRRRAFVSMGFWLDVFPMLMMALILVPIGLGTIWSVVTMWRERGFAWRHRDETLHLDAQGLVFSSSTQRIEAAWDEVRAVRPLPREGKFDCFEVETASGNFRLWSLKNSSVWRRFYLVARDYAPVTLPPFSEQPQLSDEIAPIAEEAQSIKSWSFRSYGNRLLILCVSIVLGFAPLFYLLRLYRYASDDAPPSPSWPLLGGMCVVATGTIAALWIWFRRARIVGDDEGLELRSPFRRARRIAWSSLEEVGHSVWGDWIRADGRVIYFTHALCPVRKAELLGVLNSRKTS